MFRKYALQLYRTTGNVYPSQSYVHIDLMKVRRYVATKKSWGSLSEMLISCDVYIHRFTMEEYMCAELLW